MISAWQQLTLSSISIAQWRGSSYLYHLVGLLRTWRKGSWLLQWAEPLGALLISLILILAPFVPNSLTGLLLFASGIYWLLLTISDDSKPSVTPIHLLLLLYWCISLVAVAFSPVKAAAFSGLVKLTLYCFTFVLSARVLRSRQILNAVVLVVLIISLIVSVYGVRQEFFGAEQLATWNDPTSPLAKETRVYSYLGNPNLLAGYLLTPIALSFSALFVWRTWTQKALAATIILVNCACLYFTDSRGAWIGMVVLTSVFSILAYYWWREYLSPFWQKWLLPIVFSSFASLIILGLVFVEPLRLRVASIFVGRGDSSNNFRINVWHSVLEMIRDRPIIGIGPGNSAFNKIYPLYMRPRFSALGAYSVFLEIAVETGIIGFSCFIWLLLVTFTQGVKIMLKFRDLGNNQGWWVISAIAAMSGILAHGIAETVWFRPEVNTLWWLSVAIIASQYPKLGSDEQV